ncbi:hypothetical protein [Lentzea sp. NEAU-D7]|uniref:hypothetical protein n=1 Tax=Lentzea sp. NEAU-D7 TaxID=2994667 RepID=UPI00224AE91D|nr:hypothetical protein [Lentzea sp. NEAU-D7]MCX2947718.1 hypothetical protein [Lentzea sp. NEAU-D7]
MNATIHRRAPGPVPDLPMNGVRPVRDEDHEALIGLLGESQVGWWRLFGWPSSSFVAEAEGVVAASLVTAHMGRTWLSHASAAPGPLVAAAVAASLRATGSGVLVQVDRGDTDSAEMLARLGFTAEPGELPVLVVDGALFTDFDGFAREFTKLLDDYTWEGNLDAFNDILRGGFGTPDLGWVFEWRNSARSRVALGHPATVEWLEDTLRGCHPTHRDRLRARIEAARRGEGPTLFDRIVEIIGHHGPGGGESADNVILELR